MADLPRVLHGDSREVLKTLADCSVDSCVTDPPYALTQNKKGGAGTASINLDSPYGRSRIGTGNGAGGFMGQKWDTGETAFDPAFWREVLRVLKPGAHLVAFGGTRTYHRMACAIEDAGFEIRDQLSWIFGSGFPKSHNAGDGWGTALKPAHEPICFARKPLIGTVAENVLQHGTGAINIDGCRVDTNGEQLSAEGWAKFRRKCAGEHEGYQRPWKQDREEWADRAERKNAEANAKGGRWPANVIHDGSDEVVGCFPAETSAGHAPARDNGEGAIFKASNGTGGLGARFDMVERHFEGGSPARFFYAAKADAGDRLNSKHPTVKPVDLMQWLVRLVTPKGGLCLDPFAGTGTTGEAAWREGMRCILIEREERFVADIHRRIELMQAGPFERAGKLATQEAAESLPLFAK